MPCLGCRDSNAISGESVVAPEGQKGHRLGGGACSSRNCTHQPPRCPEPPPVSRHATSHEDDQLQIAPRSSSSGLSLGLLAKGIGSSRPALTRKDSSGSTVQDTVNRSPNLPTRGRPQRVKMPISGEPQMNGRLRRGESSASKEDTASASGSGGMAPKIRQPVPIENDAHRTSRLDLAGPETVLPTTRLSPFAIYNKRFPHTESPRSQIGRSTDSNQSPTLSLTRQEALNLDMVSLAIRNIEQQRLNDGPDTPNWRATVDFRRQSPGGSRPLRDKASAGSSTHPGMGSNAVKQRPKLAPSAELSIGASLQKRASSKPSTAARSSTYAKAEFRRMFVGIESEFFLSARCSEHNAAELKRFVEILAEKHNDDLLYQYSRMQGSLHHCSQHHDHAKWTMVEESTTGEAPKPLCKLLTS